MRPNYNPEDLARYRIEKAKSCLQGAEMEMAHSLFENAANRSYYCIFSAMRAVLALDQFDSKKHSGVISDTRTSTSYQKPPSPNKSKTPKRSWKPWKSMSAKESKRLEAAAISRTTKTQAAEAASRKT
jgi:uncharacterized protein (UPF0332 family)